MEGRKHTRDLLFREQWESRHEDFSRQRLMERVVSIKEAVTPEFNPAGKGGPDRKKNTYRTALEKGLRPGDEAERVKRLSSKKKRAPAGEDTPL